MLTGFISWSGSQGVMASSSTDSSKNNMKHTYFVVLERLQTKSLQNIPRNDFDTILTHQQYIIEIHILHSLIFLLTIFYIPQQIDHKRPQKILRWKFLFFMIWSKWFFQSLFIRLQKKLQVIPTLTHIFRLFIHLFKRQVQYIFDLIVIF